MKKPLALALFALLFGSCGVRYAERQYKKALEKQPYDALIVPGFPYDNGTWHNVMKIRILWATHLYKQGMVRHIIFSGAAVYSPFVEAEIMKMYAVGLGVPDTVIFAETTAEHSVENLYYSCRLAKEHGFVKIACASDPFQCKMIKGFKRRYKLEVDFIPVNFKTVDAMMSVSEPPINDSAAFVENFIPITERESKWQRFRGTTGKNIPKRDKKQK